MFDMSPDGTGSAPPILDYVLLLAVVATLLFPVFACR
jgi:hypothetical protein